MNKVGTDIQSFISSLVNTAVKVSIGDPWDFGKGKENNPFDAVIEQVSMRYRSHGRKVEEQEAVLLRVKHPFPYANVKCEFLLATPRHVGIGLKELNSNKPVSFNFLRIPLDQARSDDPFQNSSKKHGDKYFGLIGSLMKE